MGIGATLVATACRPAVPATVAPSAAAPTNVAPPPGAPSPAPPRGNDVPAPGGVPAPAGLTVSLVIDKLTYGPRPGLRAEIERRGIGNWIEDQLDPVGANVPDAAHRLAGYDTLTNTHHANYHLRMRPGEEERFFAELDYAAIQRAVYSERQLYELMCEFWANHFNVWRRKNWATHLMSRSHETVIRPHALGRFADLLKASAHDSAMANYLDNHRSSGRDGIVENYARELMELHTLGIHDGQHVYSETDVRSVAKLFSGWTLHWDADDPRLHTVRFDWWTHDHSALSILGGRYSRPARSDAADPSKPTRFTGDWMGDGDDFLDVLARHPSTARHLATKLCRRFVGDRPAPALVASTAQVYLDGDTAIAPVIRHIVHSAEFAESGRSRVRRPLELLAAMLRCTGASLPTGAQSVSATRLREALALMGQPLFERVSPDGYPDVDRFWTSSDSMLTRWAVGGALAANTATAQANPADRVRVDLAALIAQAPADTVAELIAWIGDELCNVEIPSADIDALCAAAGVAAGAPASTITAVASRLAFVVGIVFAHPLFQRR